MPCTALTKKGDPCSAAPIHGTDLCSLHTPGRATDMGKVGGKQKRRTRSEVPTEIPKLETVEDVKRFLAQLAIDVRMRKVESRLATSLGYLCTSLLKAIEVTEL